MAISIQGGEILKVLVYGAGVIAAYLAYELKKKNEDVTILARGERYKELKENGLIIKHLYFILNLCAKFSLKSQPSIYGKYGKWIL